MNLIESIIKDYSNRRKHFLGGIVCGLFTLPFALGVAAGMEFKDSRNGKWDWLDFAATALGGVIGQAIAICFVFLVS